MTTPQSPNGSGLNPVVNRPFVNVTNSALAGEWLRDNIGAGVLSGYFDRGGRIVHTPREGEAGYVEPRNAAAGDHDGPAQVHDIDAGHVSATVNWTCWPYIQKDSSKPPTAARLPVEISKDAISRPDLCSRLRVLRGVTHTPIMRSDGSVLSAPGYDWPTGYLYLPLNGLSVSVPDVPSALDVSAAVSLLSEMLAGFKWAGKHDVANYLGVLLTPLLANICPPPYKLCVISAPQPGSGKTLLASIARLLHGGVFRAEMPEDDAELRKQVSAILDTTTGPIVCIDNVTGVLRSSTLSGLLTSSRWDDRKLGTPNVISRSNDRVWVITGNNATLGGDLARRALWVTIDPGVPHPEQRTDFAIADLEGWVRSRRGALLSALLVMVRYWIITGGRVPTADRSDIYTPWRSVIQGILSAAGVDAVFDDPSSARQDIGGDDDEWRDMLAAVHAVFGSSSWTVRGMLEKVNTMGSTNDVARPISLDSLPAELVERIERSGRNAAVVAKSLGRWLMNREGRWAGNLCVRADGQDAASKVRRWKVELTDSANTVDSGVWTFGVFGSEHAQEKSSSFLESSGDETRQRSKLRNQDPMSILMSE